MALWAIQLPRESARAVASIRTVSGVEVCPQADQLWCRGEAIDEPTELRLRQLPGAWRYDVISDGQLIPVGQQVPSGKLPEGPWLRIGHWLRLELPDAATSRFEFERRSLPRVPLTLVRDTTPRRPSVLRASIQTLESYGSRGRAVRIAQWIFAMRADGECLIRGLPLPPVAGEQFVEIDGLLVPASQSHLVPALLARVSNRGIAERNLLLNVGGLSIIDGEEAYSMETDEKRLRHQDPKLTEARAARLIGIYMRERYK